MTDALGHTTTTVYDALNRAIQTTYADGTTDSTAYDAVGNRISKTDQAGVSTSFAYDALNRLVSVTDAVGGVTKYAYDELGNRISQTDANGHVTKYAYDSMGRRTSRTLPTGQVESFTYTTLGQVATRTDFNGHTTSFTYDNLGHLTKRTPDAAFSEPAASFTYTATGLRESMTDGTGTTSYTYDARSRLVKKATPEGTLSYTRDATGSVLTAQSEAAGGYSVQYGYDAAGRLASVTDNGISTPVSTGYSYDADGRLSSTALPNGLTTTNSYDALSRLTAISTTKPSQSGPVTVASYSYTLGPSGNRTVVNELGGRQVSWSYDKLYRLTQETIAGATSNQNGAIGYSYDAVGNRLTRSSTVPAVPAQGLSFLADDRLMGNGFTQDLEGNTTQGNGKAYAFDSQDRMVSVGSTATYGYDGDGNLVSKTSAGLSTTYLIDDQTPTGFAQVAEERVGGSVSRVYLYGMQRISMRDASGTKYFGYDAHSGVRFLSDASGAITDTYEYEAFGSVLAKTGSTQNPWLYRGEMVDADAGLQYLRARWMDSGTGRFASTDSFEGHDKRPLTLNAFGYTEGSPVDRMDPEGHDDGGIGTVDLGGLGGGLNPAYWTGGGTQSVRDLDFFDGPARKHDVSVYFDNQPIVATRVLTPFHKCVCRTVLSEWLANNNELPGAPASDVPDSVLGVGVVFKNIPAPGWRRYLGPLGGQFRGVYVPERDTMYMQADYLKAFDDAPRSLFNGEMFALLVHELYHSFEYHVYAHGDLDAFYKMHPFKNYPDDPDHYYDRPWEEAAEYGVANHWRDQQVRIRRDCGGASP